MTETLGGGFRGIVCDLDGVVYRSHEAIPHAVDALEAARAGGVAIAYATNNAAREPSVVAAQLRELGLDAPDESVVNSSMAGAAYLAERVPPGAPVLAVGGEGVASALVDVGLRPVRAGTTAHADPVAVLQGYGPDVCWRDLAEAAYAIQRGATWVATNLDTTIPTSGGIAPGNGSLVAAVRNAVPHDPVAVGKPETPLYELCAARLGSPVRETLAIGDRLDTDVIGANRAGMPSLCVTTGVHQVDAIAAADGESRPTYVAVDLRALHRPYDAPSVGVDGDTTVAEGAGARVAYHPDRGLALPGGGDANARLRALVALLWAVRDAAGGSAPGDLGIDADAWSRVRAWLDAAGEDHGRGGAA